MKKILFVFSLFLSFALSVNAQHAGCSKTCTPKEKAACEFKVATGQAPIPSEYQTAAAKMASLDATIEPRTNPLTGEVSYVRKASAQDGSVTYVALNYDPASSTFVNVGPSQVAATSAPNTQGCGAHATTASGKSCCAAGAATKSCCAGKAKTATASNTAPTSTEAKPTKTGGGSN